MSDDAPGETLSSWGVVATRARPEVEQFAANYPFLLDDFQIEAIGALLAGRSVLVAAPTGTGKTIIADFGVDLARRKGMRAIYTAPIKALSNQKFHDWRAIHGEAVGLLTGDVTENADGSILVMTTEVLRNMVMRSGDLLRETAIVIFDEVHFLADPDRGTTWEEAILNCPPHVQMICLSATVSNASEIAQWIGRVHRDTALVEHPVRAVPIDHLYLHDNALWPLVDAEGKRHAPLRVGGESRIPRPEGVNRGARPQDLPHPRDVVELLRANGMLPVIYFQFGRRACEVAATACDRHDYGGDREMRRRRIDRVAATLAALGPEDRALMQVREIVRLVERGIAFHHAGVLPVLKQLVEGLFTDGLLAVVFATETLALGVNMPARSVVITEHTKYDGVSRRVLVPNEYAQLSGRAGRRGKDPRGYAISLYSPWTTCREVQDLVCADLHPVRSAFTPRYHTVATLWDGSLAARDRLERLFGSSLRQFQTDDSLRAVIAEVGALREEVRRRHFACPVEGIADDAVVEYGVVRRDLADARRQVIRGRTTVASAARDAGHLPWTPPSPTLVKRAVQGFTGGEVVHLSGWRSAPTSSVHQQRPERDDSTLPEPVLGHEVSGGGMDDPPDYGSAWAVFLRREGSGPGVYLIGDAIVSIPQWAMVTRLAPPREQATRLPVPEAVRDATVGAPSSSAYESDLRAGVSARVRSMQLPDAAHLEAARTARQAELTARFVAPHEAREAALALMLEGHPCHTCTLRATHERAWRHEREAQLSLTEGEAQATRVEQVAATHASRTLAAIVAVLGQFGGVTPSRAGLPQPTDLAAGLTSIYDGNGLLILCAARRGWFDDLRPADLMEVISWFCYDRDAVRWNRFRVSDSVREVRDRLEELGQTLAEAETKADLPLTAGVNRIFVGVVTEWCRGVSFPELLDGIGISEGDLLLTLNKTLDLASQVRHGLRAMGFGEPIDSADAGRPQNRGRRPIGAPTASRVRLVGDQHSDGSLVSRLEIGDRLVRRGLVADSLRFIVAGASPDLKPSNDLTLPTPGHEVLLASRPKARRRGVTKVRRVNRGELPT